MKTWTWSIVLVVVVLLTASTAWSHQATTAPERIGRVTFSTSCHAATQPQSNDWKRIFSFEP
jgi:hypothetical protein